MKITTTTKEAKHKSQGRKEEEALHTQTHKRHIKVNQHENLHERYLTNTSFVATWASSCGLVSVSYLMDDLRHWQLVRVRVHLFLLLSIYRTEKQNTHKTARFEHLLKKTNSTHTFGFCYVEHHHSVMKKSCQEE